jgi:SAM-dependent methyltransferase
MSYIQIPTPEPEFYAKCTSETAKYRHLVVQYLEGCGIDVASQGVPVVPWAIQFDLPQNEFLRYSSGRPPASPIPLRGHANRIPLESNSLDWLYSSHFIEDVLDWNPILDEWIRVIKPGGKLVILLPDKKLWNEAIAKGQPPNCSHKHESYPGELSLWVKPKGIRVIKDELSNCYPGDYNIIFVGEKL